MKTITDVPAKMGTDSVGTESANRVLADYFHCPASSVLFRSPSQLGDKPGYFRLGPDTTCYGRLSRGDTARTPVGVLEDALDRTQLESDGIDLPFRIDEVIENLRRERYTAHFREEGRVLNEILRRTYYFIRPLLRVSVRRHLQKIYLRGWDRIPFPTWPVDDTVDRVHRKLLALLLKTQGLAGTPFIWFWPRGYTSCAIITHDVEDKRGRNFCASLMDLDESFGIRSAFQLVPENNYDVSKSFRDSITARGFEVNVHDLKHDGRLYADHAEFQRRAARINSYVREYGAQGFRSGILYRNADWFDAFEFSYDMSLPNVAHLDPQRGGCCTAMPFFIGKIVELPLTCTQDYTLFQILGDYSINLWKKQIALIRKNYGLISFIAHPDYLLEPRALDTYKALLEYLASLRAQDVLWTALPREVADWWRLRSRMELVCRNGEWRVEGPGSERACVAYAMLTGDTVVYRLPGERESLPQPDRSK
jgi:hypothetical protein